MALSISHLCSKWAPCHLTSGCDGFYFLKSPHPAVRIHTLSKAVHPWTITGSAKYRDECQREEKGFTHLMVIHALWGCCCGVLFGLCLLLIWCKNVQAPNTPDSATIKQKHFSSSEGICRLFIYPGSLLYLFWLWICKGYANDTIISWEKQHFILQSHFTLVSDGKIRRCFTDDSHMHHSAEN